MTNGKRTGGKPPPWEKDAEPETASFGTWLRRQREMREISLRDIAERTKISLRYLEAMEDDRFDLLPANVFAKGFLREYARYVGLSPDEVVNHYLSVHQPQTGEVEEKAAPVADGSPRSWTGLMLAIAAILLLALVALLAYVAERRRGEDGAGPPPITAPVPLEPSPASLPEPTAAEPAASAPLKLTLDFIGESRVRAVVDGKPRIDEMRVQGESLEIEAQQSILLTLGNASVVEAQVNGRPLPVRQGDQQQAELQIDLDTVQALQERKEGQ